MLYARTLVILASLLGRSAAAPASLPGNGSNNKASTSTCFTRYVATSVLAAGTFTSTTYVPCTSTVTSTSTKTTTPSAPTKTVTSTVTSVSTAGTRTSTATSIITSVVLTTSTSVAIATTGATTSTTVLVASTIPAPAGFVPVQSSLPNSSYTGSDGPDGKGFVSKRSVSDKTVQARSPGVSKLRYLKGVQCIITKPKPTCATVVSTVTSTVRASTPATVTSKQTVTLTSTVYPSATITVTSTQTSTSTNLVTSTSTSTSTSTLTVSSTTTTVYAACATNNMADAADDGSGFFSIGYSGPGYEYGDNEYYGLASAYDCCVAAQNDPDGPEVWYWNFEGSRECSVLISYGYSVCSVDVNTWTIGSFQPIVPIVGNAPCGVYNEYNGNALG